MEKISEGRRHSVDIPLSKTIVALRRVRSLRDPTTNSMAKFTTFFDSLNLETNSCNGISPSSEHSSGSPVGSQLRGRKEEHGSDSEQNYGVRKLPRSKLGASKKLGWIGNVGDDSMGAKQINELGICRFNHDGFHKNKLPGDRDGSDCRNKELDLTLVPHFSNYLKEGMDSSSEHNTLELDLTERVNTKLRKRGLRCGKRIRSSPLVDRVVNGQVDSPSFSLSDAQMDGSSISTSLFAHEEAEIAGSHYHGCGISCCWSKTPKFKNLHGSSDVEEDNALLLAEGRETNSSGAKYFKRELGLISDSPRSLCEKFRPRSFYELVGQHVVTQSLLSAISKDKVASCYLFHGPRGTGKTSTSRIFSAALNCLSLEKERPCGFCRQCVLFFSGRGRAAKEVDAAKMNRVGQVKALIKNASIPPVSSQFKVYVIDECQLLKGETWATFFSALDELPRYVVFVMTTDELDRLPQSALSRCQKYHFPKIRDVDIVTKLEKICVEEVLEFDKVALEFIASKSNGSLRDAEIMLDQLSLLGKRITISLVYELNGIVSDKELLDLLDLALSSDTSNTVRRARELIGSRVDPMQLISQLANLIMDILAGRCQAGNTEAGRKFLGRYNSEVDSQKLRHALKVLSDTEKQLRTSKNQITWLTVALLQLSAGECSLSDGSDSRASMRITNQGDEGFFAKADNLESSHAHVHNHCSSQRSEICNDTARKLEIIWSRALENCQSNALRTFLKMAGKLSSVRINQGLAIAVVEFSHPDHVARAEKSWKVIASSLQLVLQRNVEIRLNYVPCSHATRNVKAKKPSFSLLSCSCTMPESSGSAIADGDNHSDNSDTAGKISDKLNPSVAKDLVAIRDIEGNTLSSGTTMSHRTVEIDLRNSCELKVDSLKDMNGLYSTGGETQEPEMQPSCFSRTLKLKRVLNSYEAACTLCLRIQSNNKLELSVPQTTSFDTCLFPSDPSILCSSSNTQATSSNCSADEDGSIKDPGINTKMHCWKAPKFPVSKEWMQKRQRPRYQVVGWVLPCSTAKESSK